VIGTVAHFAKRQGKRLVAIAIIAILCWISQLPRLAAAERSQMSDRFNFATLPLPELSGSTSRTIRAVHPSLTRHASWTSSVGASVALNDLDQDGLPNDVCYVNTRTDQVIVAPVPGTPQRFEPFALNSEPLSYNASTMAPMGCLPGDLNEDGLMDILVYYWGRTPVAFLRRQISDSSQVVLKDSFFSRQEIASGNQRWYTNAATISDLDGDGHGDLIIGNYHQDDSRILNVSATGIEHMQHSMTRANNGGMNRLFLWQQATTGENPTVTFAETRETIADEAGQGWMLAIGAADLDGDLLPEVYYANDFGPDRLLHNRSKSGELSFALLEGQKQMTTPSSKVLGRDGFKGMGVDFGDVNGDGLLDLYVSNIASEYALEESHFLFTSTGKLDQMQSGIAPYVDRSEPFGLSRSGWGWESKFGDFDNDGTLEALQATGFAKGTINRWPELHELAMGNDELLSSSGSWPRLQSGDDLSGHQHNPFFVKASNGRYYDLAQDVGLGSTEVSRGIATADVDGDGDLDFAVANQWEPSIFYRNDSPNTGGFLNLHLLRSPQQEQTTVYSSYSKPNRSGSPAIGASAIVHLPNGKQLVAQVDGGNGHSGARSHDLHFGLGNVPQDAQLQVDLHWRDMEGQIHQEVLHLSPGWKTILLGGQSRMQASGDLNTSSVSRES
jgi:enediyne biosynthesis protein E4